MLELAFDQFALLAPKAKRICVYREIPADCLTPVGIVDSLTEEMHDGVILESGLRPEDTGRHSFIAFGSMAQLRVQNGHVLQSIGGKVSSCHEQALDALRRLMKEINCISEPFKPDFIHGAVGFITYEAIRLFEKIPACHTADASLPEMFFNFYQYILMFDHLKQTLLISVIVETGDNLNSIYQQAQQKIEDLIRKISIPAQHEIKTENFSHIKDSMITTDLNDEEFMLKIDQAKAYINRGDAFQIVLSRRFQKKYSVAPFNIYRVLRRINPAPYMFYFCLDNCVVLGASPEKLVSVNQSEVLTNPIAGTRRRGDKTDEQIEKELLTNEKELSEHMMLVDLARNDLGAVCAPGSVQVKELLKVKHFSHISHITSVVQGRLADSYDALDALIAAFPAGTLSGAPKIRAMEIIDELETSSRGLYGGAICRLDYRGNLDSCIAIRMAVLKDGIATVRAGAGIVHDSIPAAEAQETRDKAQKVLDAISIAQQEGQGR